jgi:hypothetical protein
MLAGRSLQTSFMSSRIVSNFARRRFVKTYVNCNTNNRTRNMGCDSKHGNICNFLQTWHRGGCHTCLRSNYGFHCDWSGCESHTENVPKSAKLNSFAIRTMESFFFSLPPTALKAFIASNLEFVVPNKGKYSGRTE